MIYNIVPRAARMRIYLHNTALLTAPTTGCYTLCTAEPSAPKLAAAGHNSSQENKVLAMRRAHTTTCGRSVCGSAAAAAREKTKNEHVSLYTQLAPTFPASSYRSFI